MHQDGTNAGNLRGMDCTQYRVPQQGRAERLALSCLVDRKSPDHHYRYRVRHIASNAPWRFHVSDCSDGKRVVAHNPLFYASHVRTGGTTFFVLEGPPSQPVVECRFPAAELRQIMLEG